MTNGDDKSIHVVGERAKYFVRFHRLRYEFEEHELPKRSYVKVTVDPDGRHLRRLWLRQDGTLTTREELQYSPEGALIRIANFDASDARKGHTVINDLGGGRRSLHRFDASGKPVEVIEEKRNERGFLLWELHQKVTEHGEGLELVQRIEYEYPLSGVRHAYFFDADGEPQFEMIDKYNEHGDLLETEKLDAAGKIVSRSVYSFDSRRRVMSRTDYDGDGNVTAEENYQE